MSGLRTNGASGARRGLPVVLLAAVGTLVATAASRRPVDRSRAETRTHPATPIEAVGAQERHARPEHLRSTAGRTERSPSTVLEIPAASHERVPNEPRAVRLRGTIRSGGRPVEDLELDFEPRDAACTTGLDFDVTDEHGRFEVELPPGGYTITSDQAWWWRRHVELRPDATEPVLELTL